MATKNLFFKSIPISYDPNINRTILVPNTPLGTPTVTPDTPTTWTRQFTDRIEATESAVDTGTVVIYYNGQAIKNDTGVGSPTDRFYYTVTTSPGTINPTTGVDSGSLVTFVLRANQAYKGAGYVSGTSASTLSNYDTFNVTYYYTIYTA